MNRFIVAMVSMGVLLAIITACHSRKMEAKPMKKQTTSSGKLRLFNIEKNAYEEVEAVVKSENEWEKELSPEQFHVTREHGTERAFTGEYWNTKQKGVYKCIACGTDLFSSDTKFDSGTGWPSFWQPVAPENIGTSEDNTLFMRRVEVHCPRCQAHLGHVFEDGPEPTGLRYCINSVSLKLKEKK